MKQSVMVLSIVCFVLIFCSCKRQKRYPEDPRGSFKTPQERLRGQWKITEFKFGELDVIPKLNNLNSNKIDIRKDVTMQFFHNDDYNYWAFGIRATTSDTLIYDYGDINRNFEFSEKIYFDIRFINSGNPQIFRQHFISPVHSLPGTKDFASWTITKLYGKDLHLLLQTDSGNFFIYFNKEKNL